MIAVIAVAMIAIVMMMAVMAIACTPRPIIMIVTGRYCEARDQDSAHDGKASIMVSHGASPCIPNQHRRQPVPETPQMEERTARRAAGRWMPREDSNLN